MLQKKCTKCGEVKGVGEFYKYAASKDRLRSICKKCDSTRMKKYRLENRDVLLEKKREYYLVNKDTLSEKHRGYYLKNRDTILERWREYHLKNRDTILEKKREYRLENRDVLLERNRKYYLKNKDTLLEKGKEHRQSSCCNQERVQQINELNLAYKARQKESLVEVQCYHCKNYYTPTNADVNTFLRGDGIYSNLYCSDECKASCKVYRFVPNRYIDPDSILYVEKDEKERARRCQTDHLKQLQLDECGYNYCERCGKDCDSVDLHHTLEVSKFGLESISSAGHMLVCKECHKEFNITCREE